MSVRASDVARPRDDSLAGVARRKGAWTTIALALWLVPMLAVQAGALLERRGVDPFGPRALVQTVGRLLEHAGREPWWRALPHPAAAPHHPGTLLAGLVVALAAYAAVAARLWSLVLARSGQRALDERRRHELDGARWAHHRDVADDTCSCTAATSRFWSSSTPRSDGALELTDEEIHDQVPAALRVLPNHRLTATRLLAPFTGGGHGLSLRLRRFLGVVDASRSADRRWRLPGAQCRYQGRGPQRRSRARRHLRRIP